MDRQSVDPLLVVLVEKQLFVVKDVRDDPSISNTRAADRGINERGRIEGLGLSQKAHVELV